MGSGELWCLIDFNYNVKFGPVRFYGLFIKWNKANGKRKFSHEQICSYSPKCTCCFLLLLCACRLLTLLPESTEALPSPATRNHLPRWSLSVSKAPAWFLSPIGPWPASSNRLYWLDNLKSGSPWKPQTSWPLLWLLLRRFEFGCLDHSSEAVFHSPNQELWLLVKTKLFFSIYKPYLKKKKNCFFKTMTTYPALRDRATQRQPTIHTHANT